MARLVAASKLPQVAELLDIACPPLAGLTGTFVGFLPSPLSTAFQATHWGNVLRAVGMFSSLIFVMPYFTVTIIGNYYRRLLCIPRLYADSLLRIFAVM